MDTMISTVTSRSEGSVLRTRGTPQSALSTDIKRGDEALWKAVIDRLLKWSSDLSIFAPDDRPDALILRSAIDFAYDSMAEDQPAPTSMMPSGQGAIAFEWDTGRFTQIVELTGIGTGTFTSFKDGKIVAHIGISRDPETRW